MTTACKALLVAFLLLIGSAIISHAEDGDLQPDADDSTAEEDQPSILEGLGQNESLRAAADRIRKEKQFSKLRKERRDILEAIPKVKTEADALQVQVSALKTEKADLEQKLAATDPTEFESEVQRWKSRLEIEQKRLDNLQKQQPAGTEDEKNRQQQDIVDAQQRVDYLRERVEVASNEKSMRNDERAKNENRLKDIASQLPALEKSLADKNKQLYELLEKQFLVEDAINVLLIPETARNEFKLYITAAFSILVACVIIGFFVVSWRDETVRRAIFSGQSGIQFLTLFSLVIAIILFGITEVLEGKELAALLGGLSGYILGRVTTT